MKTLLITLFLLMNLITSAQYLDSVFAVAKQKANKGDYSSAHKLMDDLLSKYPKNGDLIKYKANLFAWEQKYDSAINLVSNIKNYKKDIEALNMISLFLTRNKQYESALQNCTSALQLDTNNINTQLLELDILMAMKNYKTCFEKSSRLKNKLTKAQRIHSICANKLYNQRLTVGVVSTINQAKENRRYNLQYQVNTASYTSISTINLAQRTTQKNFQFSQEVYRNWNKYGYSFGSLSLSNSSLFPKYAFSVVHFTPVANNTELDLGIRYYRSQNKEFSLVPSIGAAYTLDKITFNYRYYKIWGSQTNGNTHTISVRKNFNRIDDNVRLDFGIGNQFNLFNTSNTAYEINSKGYNAGCTVNKSITPKVKSSVGFQYANSLINETTTINQFTTTLSLTYKFKTY